MVERNEIVAGVQGGGAGVDRPDLNGCLYSTDERTTDRRLWEGRETDRGLR